ncbi:unnamed protein product, partial [Mesorhabditis spiculigera]
MLPEEPEYSDYEQITISIPLRGLRQWVAITYSCFNVIGFAVNIWLLYVIAPLLLANTVKVPKSILFYIFCLCISDLMTMIGMLLLIIDLVVGTWPFGYLPCITYLVFDGLNKFVAPIIVFLISRTCYTTVCQNKGSRDRAASIKWAIAQIIISLDVVMLVLRPVFQYGQVYNLNLSVNQETKQITVMRKCGFWPPPDVALWFNIVACVASYAIPLFGILYCYISVPMFLNRRAETSIVTSSNMDAAIKRVVVTVLVLCGVYLVCWSPYWVTMFYNQVLSDQGFSAKTVIIVQYFIHLLPYVSCLAYPVIFVLMNRGIRQAHQKIAREQRKRFKSIADDATNTLRNVISRKSTAVRSRLSSYVLSDEANTTEFTTCSTNNQYLLVQNGSNTVPGTVTVHLTDSEHKDSNASRASGSATGSENSHPEDPIHANRPDIPKITLSPSEEDEIYESETLL